MDETRREVVKKLVYVTPTILTLAAVPSYASTGSNQEAGYGDSDKANNGLGNGRDPAPPGNPRLNDGPNTSPGHPGTRTNCGTCHTR